MYRAGELFRRSDRPDDAVRCLESALRISDTHLPALDALEQVWRERGDLERVSVILGRKVAATARHPHRQKPLLSRLGDLQDQLGRPDVALATHQRALEIDATWRPSLRYVTARLQRRRTARRRGRRLRSARGRAPGDSGRRSPVSSRASVTLASTRSRSSSPALDDTQLEAVRAIALPALERAASDPASDVAKGLARLRGIRSGTARIAAEEDTQSGRAKGAAAGALSLRDAAARARAAGNAQDTFAALEAANHVSPGDPDVLRELVDLAIQLGDHAAAARHLIALSHVASGTKKGDALLQLADMYYDQLDDIDAARARRCARRPRRSAPARAANGTLRMLASEAASHLAWDVAVDALSAIAGPRRTSADVVGLATALVRAGKPGDALQTIEDATRAGPLRRRRHAARRAARRDRAQGDARPCAGGEGTHGRRRRRARCGSRRRALWDAIGGVHPESPSESGRSAIVPEEGPSVQITGTPAENDRRDRIEPPPRRIATACSPRSARRPTIPASCSRCSLTSAIASRRCAASVLEAVSAEGSGRAQAIALHELALIARGERNPIRAAALWTKAHRVDPSYAPVWMPLADALAALRRARPRARAVRADRGLHRLRRRTAARSPPSAPRCSAATTRSSPARSSAAPPAAAGARPTSRQSTARQLAENEDCPGRDRRCRARRDEPARTIRRRSSCSSSSTSSRATSPRPPRRSAASSCSPTTRRARAALWRRRAKLYRDALGRDAEAYRCLKEAHACSPADPEIAYQLRTAAMVRGEWALVASLLYREIAAAPHPRDRGALAPRARADLRGAARRRRPGAGQLRAGARVRPDDPRGASATRAPLRGDRPPAEARGSTRRPPRRARRRSRELARGRRALQRARAAVERPRSRGAARARRGRRRSRRARSSSPHQLWRLEPGHAAAFRVLASVHRASGDLAALTELTTVRVGQGADSPDERAAAWLEVARLADELGQLDRGRARVRPRARSRIRATSARSTRAAQLAFRVGDFADRGPDLRDLAAGDSVLGADELALRRSIIAEQLGRDSEALDLARAAAAAAPGAPRPGDARPGARDPARRAARSRSTPRAPSSISSRSTTTRRLLTASFALVELYRAAANVFSQECFTTLGFRACPRC